MSFFAPTAHMQSLHLPTFSLIYCIVSPLGDTETFEKIHNHNLKPSICQPCKQKNK